MLHLHQFVFQSRLAAPAVKPCLTLLFMCSDKRLHTGLLTLEDVPQQYLPAGLISFSGSIFKGWLGWFYVNVIAQEQTDKQQPGCKPVASAVYLFDYSISFCFTMTQVCVNRLSHFWSSISVWQKWRHWFYWALLWVPLSTIVTAEAVRSLDSGQKLHTDTTLQIRAVWSPGTPQNERGTAAGTHKGGVCPRSRRLDLNESCGCNGPLQWLH